MSVYLDTSFLFSLHVSDGNTHAAISLRRSGSFPLVLTSLHRLELQNAIALAVFRKQLTQEVANSVWRNIESDLANGSIIPVSLIWADVFREAESIVSQYSPEIGCRSLDILHVASAKVLGSDQFITFDIRQNNLAKAIGLTVLPWANDAV